MKTLNLVLEILNILAGLASISSFFIALFIANKVIKISQVVKIDNSTKSGKQMVIGRGNKVAGRDIND